MRLPELFEIGGEIKLGVKAHCRVIGISLSFKLADLAFEGQKRTLEFELKGAGVFVEGLGHRWWGELGKAGG